MTNSREASKRIAIIFDFDGTLADTKPYVLACLNQFASEHGLQAINDITDMRDLVLQNKWKLNVRLLRLRKHIKHRVLSHLEQNITNVNLQPGWAECLQNWHEAGYVLGILTTNKVTTVNAFLKKHGLNQYFSFITSSENKRSALKLLMQQHDLNIQNSFYVGDQYSDIVDAKGLMHPIGVGWGFESLEMIKLAEPHSIIEQPKQLSRILKTTLLDLDQLSYVAGSKVAEHLSNANLHEQAFLTKNTPPTCEEIFAHIAPDFHHKAINKLTHFIDGKLLQQPNYLAHWLKLATLIAIDDLFDEHGNVRETVCDLLPFFQQIKCWSNDEKKQFLTDYMIQLILQPICAKRGLDLQSIQRNLTQSIQTLNLNTESIASLQSDLLTFGETNKHENLNDLINQYSYDRNKYFLEKTLTNSQHASAIVFRANQILCEIDNLKLASNLTASPKLTRSLIAVNDVISNPSLPNCRRCNDLANAIGKRPFYKVLAMQMAHLVKQILQLPSLLYKKCSMQNDVNVTNNPEHYQAAPFRFFIEKPHLKVKYLMEDLNEQLKPKR